MPSPNRPVIGGPEAARRLGLTRTALSHRMRKGLVPGAFRVTGPWRVDEATFEAWRRAQGDPNAKPAEAFDVDPLPFKAEGDAA